MLEDMLHPVWRHVYNVFVNMFIWKIIPYLKHIDIKLKGKMKKWKKETKFVIIIIRKFKKFKKEKGQKCQKKNYTKKPQDIKKCFHHKRISWKPHQYINMFGFGKHLRTYAPVLSRVKNTVPIYSFDIHGVPQYCLHFWFVSLLASKATRSSTLEIFQQPFTCRFQNYHICYYLVQFWPTYCQNTKRKSL